MDGADWIAEGCLVATKRGTEPVKLLLTSFNLPLTISLLTPLTIFAGREAGC